MTEIVSTSFTTVTTTDTRRPVTMATACFLLLLLLSLRVHGTCRFPEFLQRDDPWAASYTEGRLVVYVKGTYMSISQQHTTYTRSCDRSVQDNKFLVMHREDNKAAKFLCMQFIQRSQNIVQMKVSQLYTRQTLELCDDQNMALDRWPIVQVSQTPEQKITCPFMGGYNVNMFYPNDTAVCPDLLLVMRMESECEEEEGIVFDFREKQCVPSSLPPTIKQQVYCIAYWTQASHSFIILQHATVPKHTWCLRIKDPLSDIHSAYLMLDLVCDTSLTIRDTGNFFRLSLTRRVYASTCEDDMESDVCRSMSNSNLCKMHHSRHCARTCNLCKSENEMGGCAFEEQYRGQWVESGNKEDHRLVVNAYSLDIAVLGTFDCLRLESRAHKEKQILVRFDDKGCYPRYACVEMAKVTTSVMRFRLGNRHQWPLHDHHDKHDKHDKKEQVCSPSNFLSPSAIENIPSEPRPARLLVSESYVHQVSCNLPPRLQHGVAFREEGRKCSGCLMYQPVSAPDKFTVQPFNCTPEDNARERYNRTAISTLEYSCLASMTFDNNTYAVVTKTFTPSPLGQYLCWVFTPDNQIKVLKAGESFRLEDDPLYVQDILEAQFSIVNDVGGKCRSTAPIRPTTRSPLVLSPNPIPTTPANSDPHRGVTYGISSAAPNTQIFSPSPQLVDRTLKSAGANSASLTQLCALVLLLVTFSLVQTEQ